MISPAKGTEPCVDRDDGVTAGDGMTVGDGVRARPCGALLEEKIEGSTKKSRPRAMAAITIHDTVTISHKRLKFALLAAFAEAELTATVVSVYIDFGKCSWPGKNKGASCLLSFGSIGC